VPVLKTAVKFLLEQRSTVLTKRTSFEIRALCEVQKRDERPWLESAPQQASAQALNDGSFS